MPASSAQTDVLVRITTTNICGSDLHMCEGRADFEAGRWFGHENMGEVIEVSEVSEVSDGDGDGVGKVQVGDRVVLPFKVGCGHCKNCERGLTNYCLTAQPVTEFARAAYGFADMGPWAGGQAELLRVPWGDFNCLRLGEDADEKASDYVMLADIWPTGYHATELAGVCPGDQTVIYGCGPVGLMAALSATIRGSAGADRGPRRRQRLRMRGLPSARPRGNEHPNDTLNKLVVRLTGRIGSIGVFIAEDPGGPDELAKNGQVAFDYGLYWFKGQHIGSGQAPVKRYNRQLRDLIAAGKAEPSFIVSHELPLERAPEAYKHFDARDEGWTKVILKPAMAGS
ncbi:MAG: fdh [Pseudonocardiales bacterium]|nr:fdh [Pseudonocardiales bacterium]